MEPQHEKRRLTTILSADVAGYSRLMAADESSTLAKLKTHRKELIGPKTTEYSGRVVKHMGDGTLMEFGSVVDAVHFAVDVQRAMAERNTEVPEDQRITYRIGINIGDIIVEGEDIYGDGVNVAARLEALAEPGGICVSRSVYNQVKNKVDLDFVQLGERRVKNIPEPVSVYRISLDVAEPATAVRGRVDSVEGLLSRPVLAVLPFTNMSDDPEQEYFADGLTEDIITAAAAWHWVPVIARHSTFAYKNTSKPMRQVAQELDAGYLVEGSVRRSGGRVRITAQLIDANTDHHIWARRYDRDLRDIFALQDEITESIVTSIEPELQRFEQKRALRKRPENLDAWDYTLRAQSRVNEFTKDDNIEAIRLLHQAISMDPDSAYALSMLALCHYKDAILGFSDNRHRSLNETFRAAEQAVRLDDGDWLAHAMFGIAFVWTRRDFDRALEEEERAIELNPSSTWTRAFISCVLEFGGRPADAIPQLHTALRLDPYGPLKSLIYADLSLSHLLLRELESAVENAQKSIEANPQNVRAQQRLLASLGHMGRKDEARAALEQLMQRQPDFSLAYIDDTYPFKLAEDRAYFIDGLRKAGLPT